MSHAAQRLCRFEFVHPLLRAPYAALGAAAELAAALSPVDMTRPSKWRRALSARRGLADRLRAFTPHRDTARQLAWFHAPSVGEALMALPVIDALRAGNPAPQTALTWYSPSMEAFAARFAVDFRDYLPFDTTRGARTVLDALRPTALIYAKLDVWPLLTERAAERGVRVGMIAAALSEESSRRGRFARSVLGGAYAALEVVGAVSADDAERLIALGVPRDAVTVTGDTRFDQAWNRIQHLDRGRPPFSLLGPARPTVVAGSTWPADEGPLLAAWERVCAALPDARLVVAPHEPTAAHLGPLRAWGARTGLTTALLSDAAAETADVVIVDTVGVLAELYAVAAVAFVGGGFGGFGLHSVLEPAALGVPVTFGPNWRGSRDARGLVACGAAVQAGDGATLAELLTKWLRDPLARGQAGSAAAVFIQAELGAAARSVELLNRLLH
jgi:3-deoxy-D-manno-octulosonic-acid transferase